MIIRVDKYTDENGRLIEECSIIDNENLKPFDRFIGTAALQIDTPMGSQRHPFKFKIEANDLKEAFANFTKCATKEGNEIERKQMEAAKEQMEAAKEQIKAAKSKIEIASKIPPAPQLKKNKIIM